MAKHDFPYDFTDICEINYLPRVGRGKVEDVDCPFCGRKRKLNVNNTPGKLVARCNKCGWYGGILKFHGDLNSISDLREAKRDIEKKLSLDYSSEEYKKRSEMVRKAAEKAEKEEVTLPLAERSRLYNRMGQFLKLDQDHYNDLRKRGLSSLFIEARGYKTLPTYQDDRYCLARQMLSAGYNVKNLPGFYQDDKGDYCLKKFTRGFLIPVRSLSGEIEGYQIRKDNDKIKKVTHKDKQGNIILDENGKPKLFYDNKFWSLSSPTEKNGGKMHGVCHYAGAYIWDDDREQLVPVIKKKSVKFTEGPLKADCYYFLTGEPMLGILGADNAKQLKKKLEELLVYYPNIDTVEDCLDMDYLENPNVERAIEKIKATIEEMGLKYIRRTWNPEYKGVDDFALACRTGAYQKK